jgi:N-acetylglucosamine-6-sulfatase
VGPRLSFARLLAVVLLSVAGACRSTPSENRPDIVVIMTDDQRWDIVTPEAMPYTVKRLEGRGVTCANAFATTAVCCPARLSFLTGDLASRHGVHTNVGGAPLSIGPDKDTLATRLKAVGYRTGIVGKYLNEYAELGPPHRDSWYIPPGWDFWQVFRNNGDNYLNYALVTGPHTVEEFTEASNQYSTDLLARRARAFIRSSPARQPFFLFLTPFGPHLGVDMVASRYEGRFAEIAPARPPSFNEPDIADKASTMQRGLLVDPASTADVYRRMQLEALLSVDDMVRTIVRATKRRARDTVIVFTSDQGFFWGEHRLTGKGMPYDEAHRVPLVIVYPRVLGTRPRIETGLITHQDLTATLAVWAGTEPPGHDGLSFATALAKGLPLARHVVPLEGWTPDGPLYTGTRTLTEKVIKWHTGEVERYVYPDDPYEIDSKPLTP